MLPTRRTDAAQSRTAPDLGIVDALVQTSFAVQAILTELAGEHDLSIVQLRLLGVLRDREPRMAQLAQLLGLTRSSATGLVDRAAHRGLVKRTTIAVGDERAVHVMLTVEGRALVHVVADQIAWRLNALVEDLSESGRRQLSRRLTQLVIHHADLHGVDLTTAPTTTVAPQSA